MGMLTEVKFQGTDIGNRLVNWQINETFGQAVGEATLRVTNGVFTDIPDLNSGDTVTIKRGRTTSTDQFVFEGFIDRIDKQGPAVTIYCKDQMIELIKATVRYSYNGLAFPSTEAKGSDIVKDLIETHGGMTASVVDTGTVLTLKKFICNDTDVFSRIQMIADIYDYQVYYDPDDSKVHFEPKGFVSSTDVLYVGGSSSNTKGVAKWKFDNSQCVNKLIVKGAVQEVEDDEYFDGDGTASQIFTLAKKPIAVHVFELVAAVWVEKKPGVTGSTSGTFDYEVDKETKQTEATTAWSPAVGTDNVWVKYTNAIPVPVQVQDFISQGKYGVYSAVRHFTDVQTVADAEERGKSWISRYSEPFAEVSLKPTQIIDIDPGQLIQVIDTVNDENRSLVVNMVVKKFPHNGDELTLGDKEWKLEDWGQFTIERIRRLEEELQKNEELIINLLQFPHPVNPHRRYADARLATVDQDGWIWGRADSATWGTDKWGSPFSNPSGVLIRRVWENQKYIEKFIDEDFKGATTAVWSTSGVQF